MIFFLLCCIFATIVWLDWKTPTDTKKKSTKKKFQDNEKNLDATSPKIKEGKAEKNTPRKNLPRTPMDGDLGSFLDELRHTNEQKKSPLIQSSQHPTTTTAQPQQRAQPPALQKPIPIVVSAMLGLGVFLSKISNDKAKREAVVAQVNVWQRKYDRAQMIQILKEEGKFFSSGNDVLAREQQLCSTVSRSSRTRQPASSWFDFFVNVLGATSSISQEELSAFLRIVNAIDEKDEARACNVCIDKLILKLTPEAIEKHALFLSGHSDAKQHPETSLSTLKKEASIALIKKNKARAGTPECLRASKWYGIVSFAIRQLENK